MEWFPLKLTISRIELILRHFAENSGNTETLAMFTSQKTNMESHAGLLLSASMIKGMLRTQLKVWMEKIWMDVNFELILLDTIGHSHPEDDNDQGREVVIADIDPDHAIEEDDLDPDLEINHEIDREAAREDEADPKASQKAAVEAKRLGERKVDPNQDPNLEADLVQKTLATNELG